MEFSAKNLKKRRPDGNPEDAFRVASNNLSNYWDYPNGGDRNSLD